MTLSTVLILIVGSMSKYILDWLKRVPWFNLVNDTSNRTTKHVAVICIVAVLTLIVAFFSGTLDENMMSNMLTLIINTLLGSGTAVLVNETTKE
jgi:uncharacterized membrane protein